jgi:hypothetical protein
VRTESLAAELPAEPDLEAPADGVRRRRFNRPAFLAPTSPVPVAVGVVVIAAGFALISVAWAQVAGLTNVALQMPYLVSAGITAVALVMVGVLCVNLAVKRQDAAERRRQMEQLTEVLQELRQALEKSPRR